MTRSRLTPLLLLIAAAAGSPGCRRPQGPEVVVYTAVDQVVAEPILQQFESQSGIRVRAVYDAEAAKTSGLVARLLAESGSPRCDVFWNNEPVQTLLLAERNVLDRYEPPAAADIPAELKDAGGRWTAVGLRARVVVYNTKHVAPQEVPRSIFDLALPTWRGKVAIADPQFGTTRTHVAALFAVAGPERTRQFLEDLLANQVRIVDGNARVKNLVARAHPDASPVYVGLTDTDDVLSGQAEGEPVDMVYPDQDTIGTLVIPSTVSLIRGAPHPVQAQPLIDFLTGPEVGSQLATGQAGFMSVRGEGPAGKTIERLGRPRAMKFSSASLLEQLEPSSQWTKEHFHR